MTSVVHRTTVGWAAAHRTVLFLLALAVAVVTAVAVALVVGPAADRPTTGSVAPSQDIEGSCAELPMTGTFC
jgi:hypothetical protein